MNKSLMVKRNGSFIQSLPKFPVVLTGFFILFLTGSIIYSKFIESAGYTVLFINLLLLLITGFSYEFYYLKSRGGKAGLWLIALFFAIITSPIGLIIYFVVRRNRIDSEKPGYCPGCGKSVSFGLTSCPYCKLEFD